MLNFTKPLILSILIAIPYITYAENTSSLKIVFVNHSHETLIYTGTTNYDPANNTFSISYPTIHPGDEVEIIGTTTEKKDLAGNMHFKNESGRDNIFTILDKRMFHVGKPILSMDNKKIKSHTVELSFNRDGKPRELAYIAAVIELNSTDSTN